MELEEKVIKAKKQYPNNFADIYDKKAKAFAGFLVFIIIIAPGLFMPVDAYNGLAAFYSFFGPVALLVVLWSLTVNYSKKNNPPIHDNGTIKMVEGIEARFGHYSDVKDYCASIRAIIQESIGSKKVLMSSYSKVFSICYYAIVPALAIWVVAKNII